MGRIAWGLILGWLFAGPAMAAGYASAAHDTDTEALIRYLAEGGDPDPPSWQNGYSLLQFAARRGETASIDALLAAGADTEYRDHNGDRALLWAADAGQGEAVARLLAAGSPAESKDDPYGRTPLMEASASRSVESVRALLGAGANPNARDQSSMTPLHYASWQGNAEIVEVLLAAGANPNAISEYLLETPLHFAVRFGTADMVTALLGADTAREQRNSDGMTALMGAVYAQNPSTVAAMLASQTDVDARGAAGETPLMVAAQKGLVDIATMLLDRRADPTLVDHAGLRVEDYLDWSPPPFDPSLYEGSARLVLPPDPRIAEELKANQAAIRAILAAR